MFAITRILKNDYFNFIGHCICFSNYSNAISAIFYIKSANRKARYTMIEIKALRQVRDKLENLLKEANEKK